MPPRPGIIQPWARRTATERGAVDVMLRALCAGEDDPDLMTDVTDAAPNGDHAGPRR